MAYEVKSGPNRPSFDVFWDEGVRPMGTGKKEAAVVLWNPEQPLWGPVWHLIVNWKYAPCERCTDDTTCHWCRITREWNKQHRQKCVACKELKPLGYFPADDGNGVSVQRGRRKRVCVGCTRKALVVRLRRARAAMESPTKQCTRCSVVKIKSEFNREARKADGYNSWCKDCLSAYKRGKK